MVSVGAGPVFKKDGNQFIRIDNTSLHRNQVWGSFFVYNDKIHIYGGYGFWSFKDYITFYDPNIKQWDIVYNNSAYIPKGRGKSISLFHLMINFMCLEAQPLVHKALCIV